MNTQLSVEQRFALTRARYEVQRMSRPALEKTALRLLKSRMEQQTGLPEILSEDTFVELLELNVDNSEELPRDIEDMGWEDDDLEDDGLTFIG